MKPIFFFHRTLLLKMMILLMLLTPACGRKQKNIFSFTDQDAPVINKLLLPVVRGINVQKTAHGCLVSWLAPDLSRVPLQLQPVMKNLSDHFIGFNIYRLVRNNIIPKHPLNKKPFIKTEYLDKKVKHQKQMLYLIKIVFSINKQIIEGPASAIACPQENNTYL